MKCFLKPLDSDGKKLYETLITAEWKGLYSVNIFVNDRIFSIKYWLYRHDSHIDAKNGIVYYDMTFKHITCHQAHISLQSTMKYLPSVEFGVEKKVYCNTMGYHIDYGRPCVHEQRAGVHIIYRRWTECIIKTIVDEIEDNQRTERHDRNYSVEFINLLVDKIERYYRVLILPSFLVDFF